MQRACIVFGGGARFSEPRLVSQPGFDLRRQTLLDLAGETLGFFLLRLLFGLPRAPLPRRGACESHLRLSRRPWRPLLTAGVTGLNRSCSAAVTFFTDAARSALAWVRRRFERRPLAAGILKRGHGRDWFVVRKLDVDQAGVHQRLDDVPRLEHGEAALGGELGDVTLPVNLAQQGPVGARQDDVGGTVGPSGQHGNAALATDRRDQLFPAVTTHLDLGQQVAHRHRRRDVLAGLLVLAELVRGDRPSEQYRHRIFELLDDERLDDVALDVAEVHQQLTEPPPLQLVGLHIERGRQRLG